MSGCLPPCISTNSYNVDFPEISRTADVYSLPPTRLFLENCKFDILSVSMRFNDLEMIFYQREDYASAAGKVISLKGVCACVCAF